jgi:ribosomal protein S18 acetylase RimI-like enzyme
MPQSIHPPSAVHAWISRLLTQSSPSAPTVWVASTPDRKTITGYLRIAPGWLEDLYVDPSAQRQGVGLALLARAKDLLPEGFSL